MSTKDLKNGEVENSVPRTGRLPTCLPYVLTNYDEMNAPIDKQLADAIYRHDALVIWAINHFQDCPNDYGWMYEQRGELEQDEFSAANVDDVVLDHKARYFPMNIMHQTDRGEYPKHFLILFTPEQTAQLQWHIANFMDRLKIGSQRTFLRYLENFKHIAKTHNCPAVMTTDSFAADFHLIKPQHARYGVEMYDNAHISGSISFSCDTRTDRTAGVLPVFTLMLQIDFPFCNVNCCLDMNFSINHMLQMRKMRRR